MRRAPCTDSRKRWQRSWPSSLRSRLFVGFVLCTPRRPNYSLKRTDDPEVAEMLHRHTVVGELVTVRCGLLEVSGHLSSQSTAGSLQQYAIQIQGVKYGPPAPTDVGA